jgi:hypothetical protein
MKYLLIALASLLITACSPKYIVKTLYIQPSTEDGKSCVKECSVKQETCQIHCNQKRDNCLKKTKQEVKAIFPSILNEYDHEIKQYQAELHRYNRKMALWEMKYKRSEEQKRIYRKLCNKRQDKRGYECRLVKKAEEEIDELESSEPEKPTRPKKPSLSEEIEIAQKSCSNECGCQKKYDNCFISCGGTLNYKKFCIKNCK